MKRVRVVAQATAVAFLVFGGLVEARAQTPPEPATSSGGAALTIAECRRLALANNLVLRAQRESLAAAGFLSRAELGAFEPEFAVNAEREKNQRENTIEQTISQGTGFFAEENDIYGAGIEGLAPSGGRYRIGYSLRDLTNNLRLLPTDPLREQFQSFVGVSVTQPLLRDAGTSAALARLRLARGDENLAVQDYRRQMLLVLGSVETAYWDLYVAQGRERLRLESVSAAEKLLAENRDRVREGKMAEIELVEAVSGLARRRSLASEATQKLVDASARLKTLFAEPVEGDDWRLRAADEPPTPAVPLPIDESLRDAMQLHPEYLARLHKTEQDNVRVAYAKNQRWPQLDLKASYGLNGLGDDFGSSYYDLERRKYEAWSVGIEFRVPIGLGVKRGNELRAAQARRRESLLNLKAAEIEIANNLRGAQRKVASLLSVAADYEQVADAGRRLLDNERKRFAEGKTDSRRLLDVENELADAAIAALEARGEYEKARIEFDLSSGRLLRLRGVDLVADAAPAAR